MGLQRSGSSGSSRSYDAVAPVVHPLPQGPLARETSHPLNLPSNISPSSSILRRLSRRLRLSPSESGSPLPHDFHGYNPSASLEPEGSGSRAVSAMPDARSPGMERRQVSHSESYESDRTLVLRDGSERTVRQPSRSQQSASSEQRDTPRPPQAPPPHRER